MPLTASRDASTGGYILLYYGGYDVPAERSDDSEGKCDALAGACDVLEGR